MTKIIVRYPLDIYWMKIFRGVRSMLTENGFAVRSSHRSNGQYRIAEYEFPGGTEIPKRSALEEMLKKGLDPTSIEILSFEILEGTEIEIN